MANPKAGDKVWVQRGKGEKPVEVTIGAVYPARPDRPERIYYKDGCTYCAGSGTHRLGMGGSRIV